MPGIANSRLVRMVFRPVEVDVVGRVGGAGGRVMRPIAAIDALGHAGGVVAHRPVERVILFEEVRPVATEAGAGLDDGDGAGMHTVRPV